MARKLKIDGEGARVFDRDVVSEAESLAMAGAAFADPVTYTTITSSWADLVGPAPTEAVIDVKSRDTLLLVVDVKKDGADDVRLRVMFGKADSAADLNVQETQASVTAGAKTYGYVEHVFTTSTRFLVQVPRALRYVKFQAKATGAVGAATGIAVEVFGQML